MDRNFISSIIFPAGSAAVELGPNLFEGCRSLQTVTLPGKLQVVGFNAFAGCRQLQSLELPASVHTIGDMAFNE